MYNKSNLTWRRLFRKAAKHGWVKKIYSNPITGTVVLIVKVEIATGEGKVFKKKCFYAGNQNGYSYSCAIKEEQFNFSSVTEDGDAVTIPSVDTREVNNFSLLKTKFEPYS